MHPYFHLFSFAIPAYGVFMAAGLSLATLLAIIRAKKAGGDPDYTLIIICFPQAVCSLVAISSIWSCPMG